MLLDSQTDFVPAELFADVQQFYAHQMGLLDDGSVEPWAATFTPDAVFEDTSDAKPLTGRPAILAAVQGRVAQLEAAGRQFRHWFAMTTLVRLPHDELETRLYALAMSTPLGDVLAVHGHVTCRDRLIPYRGSWLVRHRRVAPD